MSMVLGRLKGYKNFTWNNNTINRKQSIMPYSGFYN